MIDKTLKSQVLQAKHFIFCDIERELALADSSERLIGKLLMRIAGVPHGGGNFMAALCLLSYTEYGGRLKNNDFSDGNSKRTLMNSFPI